MYSARRKELLILWIFCLRLRKYHHDWGLPMFVTSLEDYIEFLIVSNVIRFLTWQTQGDLFKFCKIYKHLETVQDLSFI